MFVRWSQFLWDRLKREPIIVAHLLCIISDLMFYCLCNLRFLRIAHSVLYVVVKRLLLKNQNSKYFSVLSNSFMFAYGLFLKWWLLAHASLAGSTTTIPRTRLCPDILATQFQLWLYTCNNWPETVRRPEVISSTDVDEVITAALNPTQIYCYFCATRHLITPVFYTKP